MFEGEVEAVREVKAREDVEGREEVEGRKEVVGREKVEGREKALEAMCVRLLAERDAAERLLKEEEVARLVLIHRVQSTEYRVQSTEYRVQTYLSGPACWLRMAC